MPTAKLTFRLPDESDEHRAALEGAAARSLLWEIQQRCREVIKYEMQPTADRIALATEIRQMIATADGVTLE